MMGFSSADNEKPMQLRMQIVGEIIEALKDPCIRLIGVYGMPGVGKTTLVTEVSQKATEERLIDAVATTLQQKDADKKRVLVILNDIWEPSSVPNITECDHKVLVTSRSQVVLSKIGTQKDFLVEPLQFEEALHLFRKEARINKVIFDDAYDDLVIQTVKECAGLPLALVEIARALRRQSVDKWSNALQQLRDRSYSQKLPLQPTVFECIKRSYDSLESDETRSMFLLSSLLGTKISYEELLKYVVGLNLVDGTDMEQARSRVYGMMDSLKKSCLLQDCGSSESATLHDIIYDFAINLAFRNYMFVIKHDVELAEWPDEDMMMKFTHMSFHGSLYKFPERLNCPKLKLFRVSGYDDRRLTAAADTIFEGIRGLKVLGLKEMHLVRLLSSLHLLTHIQTLCLDQCVLGNLSKIGALKSLKILSFSGTNIRQLPEEIRELTGLCSLDLSNCPQLSVIPSNVLSHLRQLQELNIEHSFFVKWGMQIVDDNSKTCNASLAELNHLGHLISLGLHIPDAASLPNVALFDRLIRYKISLGQDGCWHWSEKVKPSTSRVLQLKLNNAGISPVEDGIKVLLAKAEGLWLAELKGTKNLVCQLDKHGFPELKHLHVEDNSDIECIIASVQQDPLAVFTKLESFVFNKLINLREICSGPLSPESFLNLSIAQVECCDKLQFFLSSSAAKVLLQLKELKLSTCGNMEAIFAGDRVDTEMSDQSASNDYVIGFPQLRALTLQSLPQFRAFFSFLKPGPVNSYRMLEESGGSPLVEERKVQVAFPMLEYLKIDNVPKMGYVWPGLRYDYQPQDQLQGLVFRMKQLFEQGVMGLNRLKQLIVSNCAGITHLFSAYLYPLVMKKLEVSNCAMLTQVIQMEEAPYTVPIGFMDPFSRLNSLKLTGLPKLVRICSAILFLEFRSLKELIIEDCPQMESFTFSCIDKKDILRRNFEARMKKVKTEGQIFVAPGLEKLALRGLNQIAQLCDLHNPGNFQSLKKLEISGCSRLKSLFPEYVARGLTLLLEIRILSCDSIEHIVEASIANWIVFPEVRTLVLENLPNLVSSCSGHCVVLWSSLKEIALKNCPKIRESGLGQRLREMKLQRQVDGDSNVDIEKLFALWDIDADIKEFNLNDSEQLTVLVSMKYKPKHLTQLERLEVKNCDEKLNDFLSILLERSSGLQHLIVRECKPLKHVFDLDRLLADREKNARCFVQLKTIILLDLHELTSIWNKDPSGGFGIGSLEVIEIERCDSLKNVFSFSTWAAENLRQLQKLKIHECSMIEEVVAMETQAQEIQNNVIEFAQLKDLELVHLSKFVQLHRGKCTLNFPSLENLKVECCPQMNAFTTTATATEGARDANYPRLQNLQLSRLHNLEEIWQGPVSSNSFTELIKLELHACGKLKYVISSDKLPVMQNLKKITITNCDSLEEVFHFHGESNSKVSTGSYLSDGNPIQLTDLILMHLPMLKQVWNVPCFRNLNSLQIIHCKNLQRLFSPSVANYLQQLKKLKLCSCENMEVVVDWSPGEDRVDDEESAQTIFFPELECLILKHLPSLESFSKHSCDLPKLKILRVSQIPKMEKFSEKAASTPALSAVYVTFTDKCWQDDLNTTIRYLHKNSGNLNFGEITEVEIKSVTMGAGISSSKYHN